MRHTHIEGGRMDTGILLQGAVMIVAILAERVASRSVST
jgi:hypothetical protein